MTAQSDTAIATKQKLGLTATLAAKYCVEPSVFLDTIRKTIMPSSASNEEVAAFLMVAKEYDLNPIMKEIHAFSKKGGGIQPTVGVDGWAKIISRHEDFSGVEFSFQEAENGKPVSCTCTIYRKSCNRPIIITEYYSECHRNTEPWNGMPHRMLRHKALIQCGRVAFGISGIMDEDEARDIMEVPVKVIAEDDGLKPGRHYTRRKTKESEAAEAITAEAKEVQAAIVKSDPPGEVTPMRESHDVIAEELQAAQEVLVAKREAAAKMQGQPCPEYQWLSLQYDTKAKEIDAALAHLGCKGGLPSLQKDDVVTCLRAKSMIVKQMAT